MSRTKTPSFITEIEMHTTPRDARMLRVHLDCARQVYNACLGEALKRVDRLKRDTQYREAKTMPCMVNGKRNQKRIQGFRAARTRHHFGEYALHAYAKQFVQSWLGDHLDINTIQTVATRAFRAVEGYLIGLRGRPRFKGKGRFRSVEGKTNKQGIRLRDTTLMWGTLRLPLRIDKDDKAHEHGLSSPIKYVRILRRDIRGTERWFAQLVCEGRPYHKPKHTIGEATVGLDLGPSTIASVSTATDHAALRQFCDKLNDHSQEIARLQRQIERQRRAGNPENYHPDRWAKKDKH